MSEKDPFLGLNEHMRRQAESQQTAPVTVGKVLSVHPVRVRADGLDLEGEELMVAKHLIPGNVTATVETATGKLNVDIRGLTLETGDSVLLVKSRDGQTYYLTERIEGA